MRTSHWDREKTPVVQGPWQTLMLWTSLRLRRSLRISSSPILFRIYFIANWYKSGELSLEFSFQKTINIFNRCESLREPLYRGPFWGACAPERSTKTNQTNRRASNSPCSLPQCQLDSPIVLWDHDTKWSDFVLAKVWNIPLIFLEIIRRIRRCLSYI